jgi:lipid A 3-O-deacylase
MSHNSTLMTLKNTFLILGMLFFTAGFAQKQHTKSFGFISDNDVFISTTQDQYYTNGLTLQYRFLAKKSSEKILKKTYTISLGQYMYTPFRAFVPDVNNQDRPFAGYLFADLAVAKFYKNESVFTMTYQLGVLGPGSGAESLQKWYHGVFGLPAIAGWEFQIQNQLGANINASYLKNIGYSGSKQVDFNVFSEAKIGTIFDELSVGFVSRIGFKSLNPIFNAVLFKANINADKTANPIKEFYFFVKPQLTYVAYNATIQGSLFNNDSPLTFDAQPLKGTLQVGLKAASNRFNFEYSISYLTKAVDNGRVSAHKYGTIALAYRFD